MARDGPLFTPDERRQMQLSRLRRLTALAAAHGPDYPEDNVGGLWFDPRRLTWEQFSGMPLTTKQAMRERSEQTSSLATPDRC